MLFINKLFNSIACLLSFTNLQLVIPGRTWILLYLGRTVYKRLWACLALYDDCDMCSVSNFIKLPFPCKRHCRQEVGIFCGNRNNCLNLFWCIFPILSPCNKLTKFELFWRYQKIENNIMCVLISSF